MIAVIIRTGEIVHRPLRMSASRCPHVARRRDETWSRFPLVAILLNCLVLLAPLAATSPPDPLWIPGIYDAADFDDVVVAATSLESRIEGHPLIVSSVTIVAYILPVARVKIPTATTRRSVHPRAPPTS